MLLREVFGSTDRNQIKKMYRKYTLKLHPDKLSNKDEITKSIGTELFYAISDLRDKFD